METKKIFCDITKCVGCRSCELACAIEHSASNDLFLAILESPRPKKRIDTQFIEKDVFHSIGCQHCDDAPCIEACMAACIHKDKKTGKVDIDTKRCVACWMCIMACPFAAISRKITTENKAVKCDLCPDRECPACVDSCPTRALYHETRKDWAKKEKNKVLIKK